VFTKEIQRALLDDRIDLAVHSLKDLPTEPVSGLTLAAIPPREDNRDVLICRSAEGLSALTAGSVLGTGSVRRQAQLLHLRPELEVRDIRGNVETRLRKLDDGQYDAIILARAGLRRLELEHRATEILARDQMLPAVGQGALGLEIRDNDQIARRIVQTLNHPPTWASVHAERSLLAALRAGCLAPVAAWGRGQENDLRLTAAVLSPDGKRRLQVEVSGTWQHAEQLGRTAADKLIGDGARELIADSRGSSSAF
jgi:hydroxymethylbilane synthase